MLTQPLNADLSIDLPAALSGQIAHLDQYFGVWAIHEDPFRAAVDRVGRMNLRAHVEARQAEPSAGMNAAYPVTGKGVAVIDLSGPLMKFTSSLSSGTSTIVARRQIRLAAGDPEVQAIMLRIDSPGGTVSGTHDLAADIAAAAKQKPVHAYCEDLTASAAYWAASQATKVYANPTALVGSIGTFAVLEDSSAMADKLGIKVHVVRAGEFKGMGTEGTEISNKHLAEMQRMVNGLNEHFVRGVAAGRRMAISKVRELADGRVHLAAEAADLGLIDGVQSFDETLSNLSKTPKRSAKAMDGNNVNANAKTEETATATPIVGTVLNIEPAAATYHDLVQACVGADAAFICTQLDKKATIDQASKAWMAEQNVRIEAAGKKASDAAAAAPAAKKPGLDPITSSGSSRADAPTDAVAAWNEAIDEEMSSRKCTKAQAIAAVVRKQPELQAAMIEQHNEDFRAAHPARR